MFSLVTNGLESTLLPHMIKHIILFTSKNKIEMFIEYFTVFFCIIINNITSSRAFFVHNIF